MTIKDYYNQFSQKERSAIIAEIVGKGGCTPASVYMWLREQRKPLPLYQQLITQVLRKHIGKDLTLEDLFPQSI